MIKNEQSPEKIVFVVLDKEYDLNELHDAVTLCYTQIVRFNNGRNGRLKKSVYDFYTEAIHKYRGVLKGGID